MEPFFLMAIYVVIVRFMAFYFLEAMHSILSPHIFFFLTKLLGWVRIFGHRVDGASRWPEVEVVGFYARPIRCH